MKALANRGRRARWSEQTERAVQRWQRWTDPARASARTFWQQRTQRERRLLLGMGLLLGAALVWRLGMQPALEAIHKARRELPVLMADSARVQAAIVEARALGQGRKATLSPDETDEALRAGLQQAGLDTVARIAPGPAGDESRSWQVTFEQAPAAQVLPWLAGLPFTARVQTHRAELARSNVDGRDRPGLLTGEVVLVLSTRAGS